MCQVENQSEPSRTLYQRFTELHKQNYKQLFQIIFLEAPCSNKM